LWQHVVVTVAGGGASVIASRFRIQLPEDTWVADLSRDAPDATFRLLSGVRAGETAIELGETTADDPAAIGRAIADHGSIVSYRRLELTDDRVLARYETTDTGLYEFVAESSLPVEYPVVVEDGWYEFDLTGSRETFDRFRGALEESDRRFELLSIVHSEDASGLLTERQREVIAAALRRGYFEVPRDCTLAELAADLDVDKSTASRVLRRGQARVLRWFLTASGSSPPDA